MKSGGTIRDELLISLGGKKASFKLNSYRQSLNACCVIAVL